MASPSLHSTSGSAHPFEHHQLHHSSTPSLLMLRIAFSSLPRLNAAFDLRLSFPLTAPLQLQRARYAHDEPSPLTGLLSFILPSSCQSV